MCVKVIIFRDIFILIIMLTYDIIIKHLMPPINIFSLQPNIVMKSIDFCICAIAK